MGPKSRAESGEVGGEGVGDGVGEAVTEPMPESCRSDTADSQTGDQDLKASLEDLPDQVCLPDMQGSGAGWEGSTVRTPGGRSSL